MPDIALFLGSLIAPCIVGKRTDSNENADQGHRVIVNLLTNSFHALLRPVKPSKSLNKTRTRETLRTIQKRRLNLKKQPRERPETII